MDANYFIVCPLPCKWDWTDNNNNKIINNNNNTFKSGSTGLYFPS